MMVLRVPLAAVLLASVGCATLQPVQEPARYISEKQPEVVYVTYPNRSVVPVSHPRVQDDKLVGIWQGLGERVEVPLSQVSIEAIQPNKKRTSWMIAGLSVVGVAGIWAITQVMSPTDNPCDQTYHPERCPDACPTGTECGGGNPA